MCEPNQSVFPTIRRRIIIFFAAFAPIFLLVIFSVSFTSCSRNPTQNPFHKNAIMDGSSVEVAVESVKAPEQQSLQQGGESVVQLTAEELVAKAIAPVKKEFLLPPRVRPSTNNETNAVDSETKPPSKLVKEKKSKRQLKRERLQEKNSVANLCPEVARSGDANSCIYGDKCRFSHDIEAFKSQKADNLEGDCPFLTTDGPCPYGLGCRFSATHKEGFPTEASNGRKSTSEINGLSKDVQRLLWKNKMTFPKADAQLKLLGLRGPNNMKNEKLSEESGITSDQPPANVENGCCGKEEGSDNKLDHSEDKDCANLTSAEADVRPLKKVKSSVDENHNSDDFQNGTSLLEKNIKNTDSQSESATAIDTDSSLKVHPREKKLIDFSEKLYLAPLTTVGNLPFRRVCKTLGADVTCGEMAMCTNLLQGQASEWALLRRHTSEDLFGVQICGAYPDTVTRAVELINRECTVDFIDINMGCPIDIVVNKGAGSALLTKPMRMKNIVQASSAIVDIPITVKVRTGYLEGRNRIDSMIEDISQWGASALTIHGRSRQQRYSKLADWEYIYQCARKAPETLQVLGNGDVYSYLDWNKHKSDCPELSSCMIARGALIKPWLFTEIKEQRHWDISSGERLNILKDYVRFGLQHWGSDAKGVETTRHFLLEWLSYTYRYIPVGLLDVIPSRLNWRAPSFFGRDDLETLMASDSAADWVRISEMLLGKVPAGFSFAPKHKSNAYDKAENG